MTHGARNVELSSSALIIPHEPPKTTIWQVAMALALDEGNIMKPILKTMLFTQPLADTATAAVPVSSAEDHRTKAIVGLAIL